MQALADMNIHTPTPIQAQALGPLLDEHDLIGQARTGSGKTLAFSIPLIEFVSPRQQRVQALILTPTRELAHRVGAVLEAPAPACGTRTPTGLAGRSLERSSRRV